MGNKTVRWNEGGKLLLQCVMDEEVYKLVTEQVSTWYCTITINCFLLQNLALS